MYNRKCSWLFWDRDSGKPKEQIVEHYHIRDPETKLQDILFRTKSGWYMYKEATDDIGINVCGVYSLRKIRVPRHSFFKRRDDFITDLNNLNLITDYRGWYCVYDIDRIELI